uniref:Uncharacterized protein n=1 Tax=Rhizophora mucronata TaxID=61149 RepID=A0A2P2PXD5_RHIMU
MLNRDRALSHSIFHINPLILLSSKSIISNTNFSFPRSKNLVREEPINVIPHLEKKAPEIICKEDFSFQNIFEVMLHLWTT